MILFGMFIHILYSVYNNQADMIISATKFELQEWTI